MIREDIFSIALSAGKVHENKLRSVGSVGNEVADRGKGES